VKPGEIRALVNSLDATSTQSWERALPRLGGIAEDIAPFCLEAYSSFRRWQGRASLVFCCIPHARKSDDAVRLGLAALGDRSWVVRYRACSLLAYSQRNDVLPQLRALLAHSDVRTVADARAAIDAIESANHHYFYDRDHSGKLKWSVNENASAA